jgi:ABC-type lipoprotein export system ATPase subunit
VADAIQDWFHAGGADEFNVMPPVLPTGPQKFADHLIPISQSRGLSRAEHTGQSSRDHGGIPRPPALSVRGLTKTYRGGFTAIKGLDLDIPDGAFFGLLGPNGAGKTTLIGAVCNLVRPTAGEIRVFGHPHESREARRLVGLAEQEINLDRFLNIGEILVYHAGYHGIGRREAWRRARELLDLFKLGDKAKSRHTELSGGMQRRLLIARALMHRPRLIILDEPTAGVDVDHPADHSLPGGSRGALPGDRTAAGRPDHRTGQPGGSPPPVRGR